MARRRVSLSWLLVIVAVLVAIGLGAWGVARNGTGCRFAAQGSCLRVLFIGNSYTSVNDLPGTFAALARSGGRAVEVAAIAPGGAFLADEAADPAVARAISGSAWTAVVLQEQSQAPAAPDMREARMVPAVVTLAGEANADGARPWLLETWAHRNGWPEMGMGAATMQAALDEGYEEAAQRSGAGLVRAGEAWTRALAGAPGIELWQEDGSHPTMAGTYLAACALYRALTGRSPVGLGETAGLSASDAATLQSIAAGP